MRKERKKNLFIDVIHGKRYETHRIIINERVFNLNDMKKWKLYLKLFLQYINYLHDIKQKDISLCLREIIKKVNKESKMFKRKMGYILGDWSDFG